MSNSSSSPGQSQMENRCSMEHCKKDALEFLLEVKNRFIQDNKRDKFDKFLRFYMAYYNKEERIDVVDYVERFKEIFEDHRDLLLRLNNFLPIGYEIKLPLEGEQSRPKKHVKMEDAIIFLKKIETRFNGVDDVHIYYSLLNVLNMYYKKQRSFTNVCQEVAIIFKDYPDILDEFTHFLPEAYSNYFATQISVRREISDTNNAAN